MRYVMSRQWALLERFEITDEPGAIAFDARGHLGAEITLHDPAGKVVADVRKHVFSDTHDVYLGDQRVAQVWHVGFFTDGYDIDSSFGARRDARRRGDS